MNLIKCISCGDEIELDDGCQVGDLIYCPSCHEESKIVSLSPLRAELTHVDDSFLDDLNEGLDSDLSEEDE